MQVNQNVNAANFLLVSSQAGQSVPTKEELTNAVGFADVLQNTSDSLDFTNNKSNTRISSGEAFVKEEATEPGKDVVDMKKTNRAETANDAPKSTDAKSEKVDAESQLKETEVESDNFDATEKTEESAMVHIVEDLEGISEEEMSTILETIGNLLYNVMQQFDLSLEELSAKLEEFGMEFSDLLTQDGLKDFFLQMNGVDVSDLLVDENLNQQLQSFMTQISDEIATLETMIPDMDAFVSNKEIVQMLSDLTKTQSDETVLTAVIDSGEDVLNHNNPEVVVNNDQNSNMNNVSQIKDSSSSYNQQSDEASQQTSDREVAVNEQTTTKANPFENPILQAIHNAINNVESTVVAEQPVQQTDILRQIVEQVRVNMNQQQTSLELQLYPEHLGRIQINVVSKEGVMTASIVAETETAKQAIEAGILNLKETMEQQDLKVEAIEVMVSTMGFDKSDEQQDSFNDNQTSNTRRKIDLSELGEEVPLEDEAEIEKMKATGSSVSYRA